MKLSYLFVITLLALILASPVAFSQDADNDASKTGVVWTVSGLSEINVGGLYNGIGIQHYVTDDISLRLSAGGTITEDMNSYKVSATVMQDLLEVNEDGSFYLGAGLVYFKPFEGDSNYDIIIPIGARINFLEDVTLGFEYVNTLELDPTVFTFGKTTGAAGHLTFWF